MRNQIVSCSDLTGMEVRNSMGEDVGKIKEVMIDARDGRVSFLVISVGGFLGIGDKEFALPMNAVNFNAEYATVNISKEALNGAPGFDRESWRGMDDSDSFISRIRDFFKDDNSRKDTYDRLRDATDNDPYRRMDERAENRIWEDNPVENRSEALNEEGTTQRDYPKDRDPLRNDPDVLGRRKDREKDENRDDPWRLTI